MSKPGNEDSLQTKKRSRAATVEEPAPKKARVSEETVLARRERNEVMKAAREKWELARPKATSKEKRLKLVDGLLKLLHGRVVEFVFRHDGSRIVQWMLDGSAKQREAVMGELLKGGKGFFTRLVCDRYGRHLAYKMMKVCDKEGKKGIVEEFLKGSVGGLMKSWYGADVLDHGFQTILNAGQRAELVTELLYSRERKVYESVQSKLKGVRFSESVLLIEEDLRKYVVESAHGLLITLLEKEKMASLEVVHAAVKEYLDVCEQYPKEKSVEMAVFLGPLLVDFGHSKAGVNVAIRCIKILDAKHRKKVVRGLKLHVRKLMEDEYGHRLIVCLFELIDDTRLIGNVIRTQVLTTGLDGELKEAELKEAESKEEARGVKRGGRSKGEKKGLKKETKSESDMDYLKKMAMHKYARMGMLSVFVGRSSRYFNPDIYGSIWDEGHVDKFGQMSKKDAEVRRLEIRGVFETAVGELMSECMGELLRCLWSSAVVIGAFQCEETREGVLVGVGKCLKGVGEGETCAKKTVRTLIKLGGGEVRERWESEVGEEVVCRVMGE